MSHAYSGQQPPQPDASRPNVQQHLYRLPDEHLISETDRLYTAFRNAETVYDAAIRKRLLGFKVEPEYLKEVWAIVLEFKNDLLLHLDEIHRRQQY